LRSELRLSLVPLCATRQDSPDIELKFGHIPELLPEPVWSSPFVSIFPDGSALVRVTAAGQFLVRDGCEITVERAPGSTPLDIETFLLSAVAGVVLHQRGVLPLHASCVEIDRMAIALCGTSGLGKSTLAAALVSKGAILLSDDICAVRFSGEGAFAVQGSAGLRLWPDSRNALQSDEMSWFPIRAGHAKQVKATHQMELEPRRLGAIIRLMGGTHPKAEITRLKGPGAVSPFADVIYRLKLGRLLGRSESLFRNVMRLAHAVPVYALERTASFESINHVTRLVSTIVERAA
jgi:hypothetical protein